MTSMAVSEVGVDVQTNGSSARAENASRETADFEGELSRLRQVVASVAAIGVDWVAELYSAGFRRIAVYSDSSLGVELFRAAYFLGEFIEVISNKARVVSKWDLNRGSSRFNFIGLTVRGRERLEELSEDTALLVLDSSTSSDVDGRSARIKATPFDGIEFFGNLLSRVTLVDPMKVFIAEHPGVKTLLMTDIYLENVGKLTAHEKDLLTLPINGYMEFVRQHCEEPGFQEPVWIARGKTPEYVKGVARLDHVYMPHGVLRLANRTSPFVNVVDHFRVTTGVPEAAAHTVWVTGASKINGSFVADWETVPSYLQSLINSAGLPFAVVNCGNHSGAFVEQQWRFLRSLPVKDGDIVVSQVSGRVASSLADSCAVCDLSSVFRRPHPYGELFFDRGHVNFAGNEVIAKAVFEKLSEHGFFDADDLQVEAVEHQGSAVGLGGDDDFGLSGEEAEELAAFVETLKPLRQEIGAIVVNCNPFTLGHRYLIEYAASRTAHLFVFVVEEDRSFFPFNDRLALVRQGTSDLSNVTVLPSGGFIISQRTFAEYSSKEDLQDRVVDPSMDVMLFAKEIAPALNVTVRFAGEEPLDNVTRQYNAAMQRILPSHGVRFEVIPRKENGGEVISASRVRALLETKDFDSIAKLVPPTTLAYLRRKFG